MVSYDGLNLKITNIKEINWVYSEGIKNISIEECKNKLNKDSIINSFYYFYYYNNKLFFTENIKFFKNLKFKIYKDIESKKMMIEFGYILPPYTLYKDVYRLYPYFDLEIIKKDLIEIEFKSKKWDLKKQSKTKSELEKEFEELLNENLKIKLKEGKNNIFTLSGGADSSLLLKISEKYIDVQKDFVITVKTKTQDEELKRAEKLCESIGIPQRIINTEKIEYQKVIAEYLERYSEIIFDPIAPIQYEMINNNCKKNSLIIEGQAADSLYLGLPHNLVYNFYKDYSKYKFFFKVLAYFLKDINLSKSTKGGRFIYRLKKLLNSLKQETEKEFLYQLLGEVNIFGEGEYIKRVRVTIDKLLEIYSPNYVIAYFFMYRILPVREMQKYRMLRDEGYEFTFPYIEGNAINFFLNIDEKRLTEKKERKKIIFDICKKILPEIDFKGKTSPFYYCSEDKKEYRLLKTLNINSDKILDKDFIVDNIKNYLLFEKKQINNEEDM